MNLKKRPLTLFTLIPILMLLVSCNSSNNSPSPSVPDSLPPGGQDDPRSYQHGVDFIKRSDGSYVLVWSSSGNPPLGVDLNGEWRHDVYYSIIDPNYPLITPVKLISYPYAQEPVSSAINPNGHIMITMEDSWRAQNELSQTYAVYDENLNPIKPYQNKVFEGGHSGHVSSVGNNFIVFYSEGWVDGGGVDNLGSGDDVLLNLYDSDGELIETKDVAVGDADRDWWPLVTGSNRHALLAWQRFVEGKTSSILMLAVYDPLTNEWVKAANEIAEEVKYYTYDIEYLDTIDRFLVSGSYENGGGFSFLLSQEGDIISKNLALPSIVREAQPALKNMDNGTVKVVYPTMPNQLAVLSVSRSSIILEDVISVDHDWSIAGIDGIFLRDNAMYFVSLLPAGLKEVYVDLND